MIIYSHMFESFKKSVQEKKVNAAAKREKIEAELAESQREYQEALHASKEAHDRLDNIEAEKQAITDRMDAEWQAGEAKRLQEASRRREILDEADELIKDFEARNSPDSQTNPDSTESEAVLSELEDEVNKLKSLMESALPENRPNSNS